MSTQVLDQYESIGGGLLQRSLAYQRPAPMHLPIIEQMFNDIYDDRYKLGTFNQVRWLQGQVRKRRWRNTVDNTYEQMGVKIMEKMIDLVAFQADLLRREWEHSVTLRETSDRQILYDQLALETEFKRVNEHARLQRAGMILQGQIDQAYEKLRLEYGLTAGAQTNQHLTDAQIRQHQHELRIKNQEMEQEIRLQVSAAGRTTDVLAAIGLINRELDAINQLTSEDEKHRRFTVLMNSLSFMLGGTQQR